MKLILIIICFSSSTLFGQKIQDSFTEEYISDTIFIDPLSTIPLYIETIKNIYGKDHPTSSSTGFILEENNKYYLITNWHVVSSMDPRDNTPNKILRKNQSGESVEIDVSKPEKLKVYFHGKKLGEWVPIELDLYESEKKLWLEHPEGQKVDVVAILLNLTPSQETQISLFSLNFKDYNDDLILYPSINLSIIGFPYGFSSFGKFPIWKTGQLASDFGLKYDNLPVFLIDAATRSGMSGSPVIIRQSGTSVTSSGLQVGGTTQKFLGVYSGRIHKDGDIGMVWKIECLKEIIK